MWLIRALVCHPDGVGYLGHGFHAPHSLCCYRERRCAAEFATETEAWTALVEYMDMSGAGRDKDSWSDFWVEKEN